MAVFDRPDELMISRNNTYAHHAVRTRPPVPARTWIVAVAVFLVVGIAGSIAIDILSGHGPLAAIAALIIVPAVLILFALGLRRSVARARGMLSRLRWWHWIWFLIFASALVFRVRGVNSIEENPVDAWAMYRIGLEAIVAVVLAVRLALRQTYWIGSMFRGFIGILTAFAFIEIASTFWSVYPSWTFYKSCEYLLDIAVLAAVVETVRSVENYRHFFNWTWALYGLLAFSAWVGAVLWPQEALYGAGFKIGTLGARLRGVMPDVSSNDVGTFAAIVGVIALSRLLPASGSKPENRKDRPWWILLIAASAITMVYSQTRSAIAGFLLGAFLILLLSKRLGVSALLTFVVGPILVAGSLGGLVWSFLERGQDTGQLEHLSSRVNWWSFGWHTFLQRPFLGFGAYAGGRFAVMANLGNTKTSTMHSDYLEMIVGTGFWGIIIFLVALIGVWWFLIRYFRHSKPGLDQQLAYEAIAVLALLTLRSVVMTMLTWHPPLDYFVIVGYAEYLRRRRLRPAHGYHPVLKREPELAAISPGP